MSAFTTDRLSRTPWIANRALDLGAIDAVGFDLDHTLALYDDAAVNALAMAEAQELLVAHRGYRTDDVIVDPQAGDAETARALAIHLAYAHVVKLDTHRRVRVARHGGRWLAATEIGSVHTDRLPDRDDLVHPLSSPFDVPTMWLFEAVTRARVEESDPVRACRDVREMLDHSHTRGTLKGHLVRDLARFVSAVEGTTERLSEWQRAGKRLFVVTNSDLAYATAVLDLVIGPSWRRVFTAVATSSAKPLFFERSRARTSARAAAAIPGAVVLEGGHADDIEALVGARGDRVLYVGDNARADIRAARSYGWKTVHVVAELSNADVPDSAWGSPFTTGQDPSWFARVVGESADAVCDRVDRLLARAPNERIEVEGETA